jgi:hypothetical protein
MKQASGQKNASALADEEQERNARSLAAIQKAYRALSKDNYSSAELIQYERCEIAAEETDNARDEAKARGKAAGLAEGGAKVKRAVVSQLQQQGSDKNFIAQVTGLPPQEVEKILSEIKG